MVRYNKQRALVMGRRRQAAERNPSKAEGRDIFPSSPTKPPKHTLYITNQEEGFLYTPAFRATFAAKKAVDYILGKNERWEWQSKDRIRAFDEEDGWCDIRCSELEEIVDYDWLEDEEGWELPPPYPHDLDRALRIKYDPRVSEQSQRDRGAGRRHSAEVDDASEDKDEGAEGHQPRKRRDGGEDGGGADARKRQSAGSNVSLADIAGELGIDPRKARAMLRGKVDKPTGGWSWPKDEVETIKKLLK
jgi:hypothetical protein